jgi:hypothetical protein
MQDLEVKEVVAQSSIDIINSNQFLLCQKIPKN